MLRYAFAVFAALGCLASPPLHAAGPTAWVRVAFDRDGVVSARAEGFADVAAQRRITVDDPVRIASLSKFVVALGAMRLVEQGKLDLDADLSPLLGWRLRHPAFPDVPITLRLLLSHRAGLTDEAGYYAVPLDGALKDVTDDPRAWDTAHAPGTFFRYANLDFPLVASAMEKATGERFDRLIDRLVLRPFKLDACFNWTTCNAATIARAVVLYDADRAPIRDDLHGQPPECPVNRATHGGCDLSQWQAGRNGALFSPQGGLRISASGLATLGRLLLGDGEVDGVRLLSRASMRTLVGPEWTYSVGNGVTAEEDDSSQAQRGFFCRYGLAVQTLATSREGCRDDPFGDGVARVGHAGSAYGLLSGLWVDRRRGTGVAYFVTGLPDAAPGSQSAFTAAEEALALGEAPTR